MTAANSAMLIRIHEAAATAQVIRLRPSRFTRTSRGLASRTALNTTEGVTAFERSKRLLVRRLVSAGYTFES